MAVRHGCEPARKGAPSSRASRRSVCLPEAWRVAPRVAPRERPALWPTRRHAGAACARWVAGVPSRQAFRDVTGPLGAPPTSGASYLRALAAPCPLATAMAARLRTTRVLLTERWLERILDRVALIPERVFPTEALLDHMPDLLGGIVESLEDPARTLLADAPVVSHVMALGALRHAQGFSAHELLKEYEILGGILFASLVEMIDDVADDCPASEVLVCAHRLFQAISVVQQVTTTQFLQDMGTQVAEREDRLRAFNRTLTHEFRNRIGAALGAAQLIETLELDDAQQRRLAGVVVRNVDGMRMVLDNLLELSRARTDARQQRHVQLPEAAAEAVRQLRETARAHRVTVRVADDLPPVEVPAAAVELGAGRMGSTSR